MSPGQGATMGTEQRYGNTGRCETRCVFGRFGSQEARHTSNPTPPPPPHKHLCVQRCDKSTVEKHKLFNFQRGIRVAIKRQENVAKRKPVCFAIFSCRRSLFTAEKGNKQTAKGSKRRTIHLPLSLLRRRRRATRGEQLRIHGFNLTPWWFTSSP